MVKVRMNTADVAAEVKCLRRLIGMRCSNVYDLSPKTYVFKLMNSSGVTDSGESEKVLLLMESGVRLHTTAYVRDKSNTPSGFTLKLRKHIRTRRLEDVRQLGYDRIVIFQFGIGDNAHYVILELYAQGNILLTDNDFTVLTLLRSHRDDDKDFAVMSRHQYPIEHCRKFEPTTTEKLLASLVSKKSNHNEKFKDSDGGNIQLEKLNLSRHKSNDGEPSKNGNNEAEGKHLSLKRVLGEVLGYGPSLSEHIILDAGLAPNANFGKDDILNDDRVKLLVQSVSSFENWLQDVISGTKVPEGYIVMRTNSKPNDFKPVAESGISSQMYDEFCPLLLIQFKTREIANFETFDAALDEFYSKIESQRVERQQTVREDSVIQKLNKIRLDQEHRINSLKSEVDRCVRMAELIEYNLEDVDAAILAVRVALARGMSWEGITRMVKEEKKSGNPVAALIDKLNFEKNCMTLLLSNNLDEMDDEEKTLPVDKVEIDLALSAHANARRWYDMKKKQESKQEKTVSAHEKAFKAAEKKTRIQLSKEKAATTLLHMRKVHWFEKFNWFISSENYLIISGRDAQQNELIVKRYISKGDLYVHADLHGASSTVIKNHRPEMPVPPLTLNQAGCFTVCHSRAWDSKIVTSAWWVYPHQVSKTAPTGEYLTVGSFMIRGKKNFLPPHPLIMGFGFLFRLDDSSLGSHVNERRIKTEEGVLNDVDEEISHDIDSADSEERTSVEITELGCASICDDNTLETHLHSSHGMDVDGAQLKRVDDESVNVNPQLQDLIDRALGIGQAKVSGNFAEGHEADEKYQGEIKFAGRDKPHVSKTERKKFKKDNKRGDSPTLSEQERIVSNPRDDSSSQPNTEANKVPAGKVSRGQRSKLKKMKGKYADQDEEERAIRMTLLASAGNTLKKPETLSDDDASVDKGKTPGVSDAPKICYRCRKEGHISRDCTVLKESAPEIISNTMHEDDDIHEIAEDEKEKLKDIDFLTGNPLPTDVLLYAVPVCAPYNAIQSYKYRVKVIPGTAKKGIAAKMAINMFSHQPEASTREKELMKACAYEDLAAALIGNVKIIAAGYTQFRQKQKKGKQNKTAA